MKLQWASSKYIITVPKKMVEARGWEKGEELEWKINEDNKLELVPAESED
jgi:bifunctional DNA-binding transcriptional regulator/antitoxin component of YhaV-PrlF toxin-antitoxin module